jgi:iron(III) transport system substrate-binding protein
MLIEESDVRHAEIIVRGWLLNLATPVFDSDLELLEAINAGTCSVGIVSSVAVAQAKNSRAPEVGVVIPSNVYIDIEGIGIARHANNPHGALAVAEWLLSPSAQALKVENMPAFSVDGLASSPVTREAHREDIGAPKNVGRAVWQHSEAARLAERAQYR